MTPQQIAKDIERGIEIRRQIAELEAELKVIEERLKAAASEVPHEPLQDENREGKQARLRSSNRVLPVRFTADSIVGSFPVDGPMHKAVLDIVGPDKFAVFFKEVHKFERLAKDGQQFRIVAREHLEAEQFAKLIQATTARDKHGIAKSTIAVAWDDTKETSAA